ncbi:hypothetical protein BDW22DRAFT_503019 [Trametopsis cervina]|nr:hypothetical protein BDW22DRAFT_503019 [Trametopsis cervina]
MCMCPLSATRLVLYFYATHEAVVHLTRSSDELRRLCLLATVCSAITRCKYFIFFWATYRNITRPTRKLYPSVPFYAERIGLALQSGTSDRSQGWAVMWMVPYVTAISIPRTALRRCFGLGSLTRIRLCGHSGIKGEPLRRLQASLILPAAFCPTHFFNTRPLFEAGQILSNKHTHHTSLRQSEWTSLCLYSYSPAFSLDFHSLILSLLTMEKPAGVQYQEQLMERCARGEHDPETKYGTLGIILAIVCFPCGLICLCSDKKKRCVRCGVVC